MILLSIIMIIVFGYYFALTLAKLGLAMIKVLASIAAFFLLVIFMVSSFGIMMLPVMAVVFGIILLSTVCNLLLRRHRPYLFRRY